MTMTTTRTTTYTVTDIRRVLASFAADYSMIAQATATHSAKDVEQTVDDLAIFAEHALLLAVKIVQLRMNNTPVRAVEYTISTQASGWTNREPGNNLWRKMPDTYLQVIATLSDVWWAMSDAEMARFRSRTGLQGKWSVTTINTSFSDMSRSVDRHYTSNGYGIEKVVYGR